MNLRSIPTSFPAATVADIDARLDGVCANEGVCIPWAIESGSRAWGFPSPDSDFDCRFVFVRPIDQHLSPWLPRDVIETPLIGELDVNGWDLAKALKLLLKGNAVIIEWLRTPIVYRGQAWFCDELLSFAARFADRRLIAKHYLHLGERQRRAYFADGAHVAQKKMFYVLRPAATLRWLRHHPDGAIAPMNLQTLMSECAPPADVAEIVGELITRKSVTRELGSQPLPAAIAGFIEHEFELARATFASSVEAAPAKARMEARELYRELVHRAFSTIPGARA